MSQVTNEKSIGPIEIKNEMMMTLQPLQVMSNLIWASLAPRKYPRFDEAPSIFEYKEITKEQIATYLEWSETSKKYMALLWGVAFNKSEIYLSSDLINNYLGYKGKVSNFYKNTLYPDYIKDRHYFEVNKDHPLVVAYSKSQGAELLLGKNKHSGGLEPKNYIATGWALKMMMMAARTAKSKELHEYYMDVEEMADFNIGYSNALRTYAQDLETKLLQLKLQQETELRLKAENLMVKLEDEKRGPKDYPDEWFYFATCDLMARSRAYKFGIITKQDTPDKRLSTYDCGYTKYFALDYVFCIKTKAARAIESGFRVIVSKYLKEPRNDVVLLSIERCIQIANSLIKAASESINYLIEMEKDFPKMEDEPKPKFIRGEDGMVKFDGMEPIAKPTIPNCPKCDKKYKLTGPREKHVAACGQPKPNATRKSTRLAITMEEQKTDNLGSGIAVTITTS